MKVLVFYIFCVSCCMASRFLSKDGLDTLFGSLINKQLSPAGIDTLVDVLEVSQSTKLLSRSADVGESHSYSLKSRIQCIICRSAFGALFDGVHAGQSDEELVDVLTVLCTALGIENDVVCRGALALNMPVLSYIITHEPAATPNAFCALLIQSALDQTSCPLEDPRFEWTLQLPNKRPTKKLPRTEPRCPSCQMKIALITDAHIDPLYEPYGVADCNEPTCCRKGQQPATNRLFFRSHKNEEEDLESYVIEQDGELLIDVDALRLGRRHRKINYGARNSAPAGYWGDYRNCDTPLWAFENALDEISNNHQDVEAIYYIGDSIDHGVWETSYELIKYMNQHVANKIKKHFGDTPVVFAVGNHEAQPTNQFAPSHITGEKVNTTWLYNSLAEKWGAYVPRRADSLRARGDYSVLIRDGLRVISLNNNVAYRYNWWLVYDPLESKRQLEWLVSELSDAEDAEEMVHILAHIPPGVHDLHYTYTREYQRVVRRFSSTIAAEFNGHTHTDEFKVFFDYDEAETPFAVAWNVGALTAYSDFNLNYKIAEVNLEDFRVSKLETHIYNLTEANLTPNRAPHWFRLYDMQQRYKLPNLSPSSISDLLRRMVTNDRDLLNIYAAFYSKVSDVLWQRCDEECQLSNLCKTVVTVLGDRRKCNELRELYFGSKRRA